MLEAFYYIPNLFRTGRRKDGFSDIVAIKSVGGDYIGDSIIKRLTGYHIKDTGNAQSELIEREVTGTIKEFKNEWYGGITIIDRKRDYGFDSENKIRLRHPQGFTFCITLSEFETFVIDYKIDIINRTLNSRFKFAIWSLTNKVSFIPELITRDNKIVIKTEDQITDLKNKTRSFKINELKIGSVYQLYDNTHPICNDYQRVVYIGKFEKSGWLIQGDYYRCHGSDNIFANQVGDHTYHVFIVLKTKDCLNDLITDDKNIIIPFIGPHNICLMKSVSRRLRYLDPDQRLTVYNKQNIVQFTTTVEELVKGCLDKINRYTENS